MVMAYLIQRNDDYIDKMEHFDKRIDELTQLIKVLQYNIEDLQNTVKTLRLNESEDNELKELIDNIVKEVTSDDINLNVQL